MNKFSIERSIMQGQQISLKWKSFHSNLSSSFESIWEEEGLVDVTLATDGRCLKAHKIMLSASSPFFKKIFQMNPCQHPVIVLQDVKYTELESILKFVYKGEVCISQDNLPLLLRAAESLQIRGLCRRLSCDSDEEFEPNDMNDKSKRLHAQVSRTSPTSPKPVKKIKRSHSVELKSMPLPVPLSPIADLPVPVYPKSVDEIKVESNFDSSDSRNFNEHDDPVECTILPHVRLVDSEDEEHDLSSNTNEYAIDLEHASENFPFPPFPCPFCDRAYTRWGFRRRHIKACHTKSQSLPCKWCLEVLPTHTDWESHVCSKHSLSKSDAKNGLMILEEAEVVLQIPQPSRLDALVTMIKEQNIKGQADVDEDEQNEIEAGSKSVEDNVGGNSQEGDGGDKIWSSKW